MLTLRQKAKTKRETILDFIRKRSEADGTPYKNRGMDFKLRRRWKLRSAPYRVEIRIGEQLIEARACSRRSKLSSLFLMIRR
jgi:hypothetical protein